MGQQIPKEITHYFTEGHMARIMAMKFHDWHMISIKDMVFKYRRHRAYLHCLFTYTHGLSWHGLLMDTMACLKCII